MLITLILVGQISLIAQHSYQGTPSLSYDFTGDHIYDAVVRYSSSYYTDSIFIFDSLSSTVLGKYIPPSGYYASNISKLANNTVLFSVYDPYGHIFKIYVYENYTSLLFSSEFNFSSTSYTTTADYNNDGYTDIIVHIDNTLYIYGTPYQSVSRNRNKNKRSYFSYDTVVKNGIFKLPAYFDVPSQLIINDITGRTVKKCTIHADMTELQINLPSGMYIYNLKSDRTAIEGKLLVQ